MRINSDVRFFGSKENIKEMKIADSLSLSLFMTSNRKYTASIYLFVFVTRYQYDYQANCFINRLCFSSFKCSVDFLKVGSCPNDDNFVQIFFVLFCVVFK